jgi:malonyl CoA-acyl carrier protein transacylase/phosphopantetheinyl transferase
MEYAVQLVYAADYGLKILLDKLEISPQALLGHSTGEITALLASGLAGEQDEEWLLQQGLEINIQLQAMEKQLPVAKLLAVGGADPSVLAAVVAKSNGELCVTMDNCPNQMVLCGSEPAIEGAYERLTEKGAICSFLPFDRAYHTPLCQPLCDNSVQSVERLVIQPPQVEIYSYVTADRYPEDLDEIRRIMTEQWARPVRFRETIEAMYDAGVRIFVEVGPRANLTSFVEDSLGGRPYVAVPTNVPTRSSTCQINHMVGLLAAHGVSMRLDYLYARRDPKQLPIQEAVEKRTEDALDGVGKRKGKTGTIKLDTALPWLTMTRNVPTVTQVAAASSNTTPTGPEAAQSQSERPAAPPATPYDESVFPEKAPEEGIKSEEAIPSSSGSDGLLAAACAEQPRGLGRPGGLRSQVMRGYLQTMERFIEQQKDVMGVYLEKKRASKIEGDDSDRLGKDPDDQESANETPQPHSDTSAHLSGATTLHHQLTLPQGPFGIIVASLTTGKELTATCRFHMDEHMYLRDHTLGGPPSLLDDTLTGLPVVPLTVSTELMAQAASLLVPDKKLVAMTDVRAHRWIEIREKDPCELLITSRKIETRGQEQVEVRIMVAGAVPGSQVGAPAVPGSTRDHLIIEGMMVFGDDCPPPPEIEDPAPRFGQPCQLESKEIYRELLFHGPTFHAIASIDRIGDRGVEATLAVPRDNRLFRSINDLKFHTDPVLLDAAGQVVGCWALRPLDSDGVIMFPTGFEALHIYRPFPRSPEPVKCYARVNVFDTASMRSDMDLIDSRGRLFAQITGWKDVCLSDWSHRFYRFMLSPCSRSCSDSWTVPVTQLPDSLGVRCTLCSEKGGDIWPRMLAHLILNRRERQTWQRIPGPEERRSEWLLGRTAAKDAVRLLLKDLYQAEACPADIEISTDEHGRPVVLGELVAKLGCRLSLSIAHSGNAAVAVVGDCNKGVRGIGIDVERKDRNHEGLEQGGFAKGEISALGNISGSQRKEWVLRLWCAKEAVAKALGRGMMGSSFNLVINHVDFETGRIDLDVAGEMATELPDCADKPLAAYTGCDEHLVFATSII